MVRRPITCGPEEDLESAAWRMVETGVSGLPVLEGAGRRLVGLVTLRDVARAGVVAGRPLSALRVADALEPPVRCCWADDTIEAAQAIMRAYRVRRLPVVDPQGRLVGLVTLGDIAAGVLRGGEPRGARELVATQAAIPSRPSAGRRRPAASPGALAPD